MNIGLLLEMAAGGFGDRVVIGSRSGGITAAGLDAKSKSGAEVIRAAGADAVVYLAVNGPAFPVAMFAAARAGVPLVPVNYRLGREQLDSLLGNHPQALGIADPEHAHILERAGLQVVTTEEWLDRVDATQAPAEDPAPADPSVPAVIIYTSGTTAAPKGVLLRNENLTSYVFGSVEFANAADDDAALVSVPPYHIAAVANVISNLYAGRRTLVLEQFTPEQWLQTVRDEHVTNALVVPTMLSRIVESDADKDIPSLRNLAYGGAPMPSKVIERALQLWPQVGFVNAYGLTETSSTITVLGPDDHREALAGGDDRVRARLGSVGRALPGVEIEIRDSSGAVLGAGEVGRICVAGEQVSAEYAGVGRVVDERGFFDTRDQGYLDEDGFLFVGGRADDTIIRGAENIAPAEIEDVILRHPDAVDVAVVGVPDDEWGQRIEAVVVLRPGAIPDPDGLRAYVRDALRSSKTPDRIIYWDEVPRTETGKLVRRNVVARLAATAEPAAPSV
ncbi:class I adenylate-forming enzyme family protein [Gordonia sp. ABSL1-1]|uniref:class I adenylate-forming enzyme family protein n=1 Tax=Gordonia sp. ABSL1-1 TaxID=3053923 RepID=UPI00257319C1|nr:class I adenylate-forming enzyme family protein [Gordonia sp. ABSL1-1]MDL9938071.1 class I adenylate-forming enzyme family protein [Gordonia sp. ABSL1-1]